MKHLLSMAHLVIQELKTILQSESRTYFSLLIYVAGADEYPGPVKWTRPYFDCGRSNRWIVAAVSPVADIYPRHTGFRHIEYPTYLLH